MATIDYSSVIEITLGDSTYVEVSGEDARTQYDTGQSIQFTDLELPDAYQVMYCNARTNETGTVVDADSDTVSIPDALFTAGKPVYVWLILSNGETDSRAFLVAKIDVNVSPARPEDEG